VGQAINEKALTNERLRADEPRHGESLAFEDLGVEEVIQPDSGDAEDRNEQQGYIAIGKMLGGGPEANENRPHRQRP
jgi:hypothetical protein